MPGVEHHGLASLAPPLLALVLALATRNVLLSLAAGALAGFTLLAGYNPLLGLIGLLEQGLFGQLGEPSHAALIVLILIIGGFVGLLEQSGGMRAFAHHIARGVRGPLGAQLAVWAGGIGIFFSDSATPLILGPIFRPVLARVGISREKLAYIVDSTASPVCVLVPFISWGAYVMGLIDQSHAHLKLKVDSFATFVAMMPLQFYPILALLAVPLIIASRREFGPMVAAQRAALDQPDTAQDQTEHHDAGASAWVIVVPMLTLLLGVGAMFALLKLLRGDVGGGGLKTALTVAYLLAAVVAMAQLRRGGLMSWAQSLGAFRGGVNKMLLIPLILLLAWSLGQTCHDLGTGQYLAQLTHSLLSPPLLSPALFLTAAVISFAMGSAWGTFAILMPIAISMGHGMGVPLLPPMAAVLSGGLFGDHASPISDTTILASMGAGCRHIDHVRTQLPYALVPALVSVVAYWATSRWAWPWVLSGAVLVQTALLAAVLWKLGRPTHR